MTSTTKARPASCELPLWVIQNQRRIELNDYMIFSYITRLGSADGTPAEVETADLAQRIGLEEYPLTLRIIDLIQAEALVCVHRWTGVYCLSVAAERPKHMQWREPAILESL